MKESKQCAFEIIGYISIIHAKFQIYSDNTFVTVFFVKKMAKNFRYSTWNESSSSKRMYILTSLNFFQKLSAIYF